MSSRSERSPEDERDAAPGVGASDGDYASGERENRMIVGIGASAGGLDAFKAFFSQLPPDSGLAFVLVQHLAPDHASVLADLLSRSTDMSVAEARDGMRVETCHVYVIPPNATLTIHGGILNVRMPAPPRQRRQPINTFFTSLAEDQGDCAIGVILAGTGSDGAEGVRAIKTHGGLTLAQAGSDDTAMRGMPASAAATGLVDNVLPVEDMPGRLIAYRRQMQATRGKKGPDGVRQDIGDQLHAICNLLCSETGHDFSQYKKKTLMRRIQRRMLVVQTDTESDYIDYLRKYPKEYQLLFHELLIGVTAFFRDPEALDALRDVVITAMLDDKDPTDRLRVWVPGCATGEEAYSIAILLREALATRNGPEVQIFATDIDERAIDVARAGRYRAPLTGISPERRERWFNEDVGEYSVVKQVRDMCIFSVHNVISDPPFSRMDLVSCRNLLIYLNTDLQRRLVQSFHYALREGGFLLLGPSERLMHDSSLFKIVDKKQRLYARRSVVRTHPRDFPSAQRALAPHARYASGKPSRDGEDSVDRQARHMMEAHSPAYVVINRKHEVLRFHGDTGHFLGPSTGAASLNLFQLLGRPLRGVVREMVLEVFASGKGLVRQGPDFPREGRDHPLRLIVEPLLSRDGDVDMCVVAFAELEFMPRTIESVNVEEGSEAVRICELEKELNTTRAQLNTAVDLHERATEELKSANEEYQSVNEELQSANEELETSTEEMQSINEELQTVNAELHSKNEELNRANDDISNLLNSTHIAAVFLEKDLSIRNFTPAATEVFHLRDSDKGRPLLDISPRIRYLDVQSDVERVLQHSDVIERVLHDKKDTRRFLMCARPYTTVNQVTDGVVLTFVDITESQRRDYNARLAAIVNSSRDAIFGFSLDDHITSWNPSAERIFGRNADEAIGQPLQSLCPDSATDEVKAFFFDRHTREQRMAAFEMTWIRPDGQAVPLEWSYSPVRDPNGVRIAGKIIARDITERKNAERHTRMMLDELNHRVKNTLASVQAIAEQTLSSIPDLQAFRESFLSRLLALSQTHNLLARDAWNGVALPVIVRNELRPYQRDEFGCVVIEGDDIMLMPKQALAISMAIHELVTNAGKYGSLSVPDGQVTVKWTTRTVAMQRQLRLCWTETGGPVVVPPRRRGFGSRLISEGLAYELGGDVTLEFPPEGVTCVIEVPLDS